jgi:hypothetical protein
MVGNYIRAPTSNLQRIATTGAHRINYRRRLNRAYLVLTSIWILSGLIYPFYRADELRALGDKQLSSCLVKSGSDNRTIRGCYERQSELLLSDSTLHPFQATYGEYREWPFTIFLVCILPPLLCYGFVRIAMLMVFTIRRASQRHQQTRPKLT